MTRPTLRSLRSAALTVGALVGVVCIISVIASVVLGIRPLVVQSGSMAPTIETGALAWARQVPAIELDVGDVVMVDNAEGNRVTHRIVAVDRQENTSFLHLQGDANSVPDAEVYPVEVAYRVFADIPYGGRVVAWLSGPFGLFLLGMYAMGLLLMMVRPRRDDEDPPAGVGKHGSGRPGQRKAARRRTGSKVGAASAAALVAVGLATPSWAAFSDTASVSGATLSTHTVQRPDSVSCSVSGSNVTFAWPEKDARYDYEIVLWRVASPDTVQSTNQVTGAAVSRQFTSPSAFGLSGSLLGINQSFYFYAEVRSWLSNTTAPNRWQSSDVRRSTQRVRIDVNCLIIVACSVGAPTCVA